MNKLIFFFKVTFFIFLLAGCASNTNKLIIDDQEITIEVARAPQELERGLMNRTSLGENAGMLFIFGKNQELYFWMKDTLIPLDMIFIDEDFTITSIQEAEPCVSDPCQVYGATGKYVLEVNKGYAASRNIKEGDAVQFFLKKN